MAVGTAAEHGVSLSTALTPAWAILTFLQHFAFLKTWLIVC